MGEEKMERGKIVYLSGYLTNTTHCKGAFASAEEFLVQMGYIVLNPALLEDAKKRLTHDRMMQICYSCIDASDIIFMVSGWRKSKDAIAELSYAKSIGKNIMYQDYYHPFRKERKNENSKQEND
jgi:hypothetical protein